MNGRRHAPGAGESAPGLRLQPRRGPAPRAAAANSSPVRDRWGVTGGMDTAVRTKPGGGGAEVAGGRRQRRWARCARRPPRPLPVRPPRVDPGQDRRARDGAGALAGPGSLEGAPLCPSTRSSPVGEPERPDRHPHTPAPAGNRSHLSTTHGSSPSCSWDLVNFRAAMQTHTDTNRQVFQCPFRSPQNSPT